MRPTIQDLCRSYAEVGFTPRRTVHEFIVPNRLCSQNGRGKGNAARRRIEQIQAEFEAAQDALADRMAVEDDQQ